MSRRVVIVGGGLAGLAAAEAAARCGFAVELFEARRQLGGRAGSLYDRATGQPIDHCQHVGLGCCTNLIDFCRRAGLSDCFRDDGRLHFFGPEGTRHDFAATGWLPAPLHLAPALCRLGYLGPCDRLEIGRALVRLARPTGGDERTDETMDCWLRRQRQSEAAVGLFWLPVLVSALSQTPDRIGVAAARKVFVDGFLAAPRAYRLFLPRAPLAEIYDRRMAKYLAGQGVTLRPGAAVRQIEGDPSGASAVVLRDGTRRSFDALVLAVPWRRAAALLDPRLLEALPLVRAAAAMPGSPITAVHLWFDRRITRLPHAVLVGRIGQWVFCHNDDFYYQVVISASHELLNEDRQRLAERVCDELRRLWPAAREAKLRHWRVITQPAAVFSAAPGVERLRPPQRTPVGNLFLAGDWTATGWPATMEGAVRSGWLAVEALLDSQGRPQRLLRPDLPRGRLARWLLGP